MLNNKVFFIDCNVAQSSSSTQNFHVLKLPRLRKHIYCFNKQNPLQLNTDNKSYSPIFKQINFELLTVFYAVVISGSVSKAAKKLSLSQPAISLSLRKIEKETGSLLFKQLNSKKLVVLTPYGLIFFNHIQRLFNLIEDSLQFPNLNLSSKKSIVLFQAKLKKLTLFPNYNRKKNLPFCLRKKGIISNYLLRNYFIDFNKFNFKYFENESRFIFAKAKFIDIQKSSKLIKYDGFLLVNKFSLLKHSNNRIFYSLNNTNIIEVQTKIAFTISIDMKISNFVCWGSEI